MLADILSLPRHTMKRGLLKTLLLCSSHLVGHVFYIENRCYGFYLWDKKYVSQLPILAAVD
jgi:hypothetical protein